MEKIPREIFGEIFLKLSIKDIIRCRYVCKTWFSITSDPQFADHHQKNSTRKERILVKKNSVHIYGHETKDHICVELPFREKTKIPEFLSSCNGLLLVGTGEKDHFLWNPYVGSYRQIPCDWFHFREKELSVFGGSRYIRLYGLGYDSVTKTYKIIRILRITHTNYSGSFDATTFRIYNCRTECWKEIDDFPYNAVVHGQGTIVNRAPHWIVTRKNNENEYIIIYFDVSEDMIKEVKTCLPSWLHRFSHFRFGILNESLCLVKNNLQKIAAVWIMKESDMCWIKLVKVRLMEDSYIPDDGNVFDQITKDFIQLRLRKNGEDVRFERTGGKAKYKGSRGHISAYKLRQCLPQNEEDIEDEVYWFDGPVSDIVFETITFQPSLVLPHI